MNRQAILLLSALALVSCTGAPADSSPGGDTGPTAVTGYLVDWWTDPEPEPAAAEEQAEFYEHITDQAGNSLDDLQSNHERYVHTIFVSHDLESFTHTHMEDFYDPLPIDAIRDSTFHFPVTWPLSGDYLAVFDYARQDQWLQTIDTVTIGGSAPQLDAPIEDFSTTREAGDLVVSLTWDILPVAAYEADFSVHIVTSAGDDVTDLTQWLGADGHCVMVDEGLDWASHTHAWFPDMENMTPTMTMPHLYPGPDLPFHYTFPVGGTYKMWVQFLRESDPDTVYAVPFMFTVGG